MDNVLILPWSKYTTVADVCLLPLQAIKAFEDAVSGMQVGGRAGCGSLNGRCCNMYQEASGASRLWDMLPAMLAADGQVLHVQHNEYSWMHCVDRWCTQLAAVFTAYDLKVQTCCVLDVQDGAGSVNRCSASPGATTTAAAAGC